MPSSDDDDHTLSAQDKDDILLSHRYRLSLTTSPSQSNFRVLALLFFEPEEDEQKNSTLPPWVPQTTPDGRTYLVGTNDEPGYMGGAICAERAAMVQLRFVPKFTITKLVIATDSTKPISPGMLCREFLAGHDSVPWDLQVLSTGCRCTECGLGNAELFPPSAKVNNDHNNHPSLPPCSNGKIEHAIPILKTTIRELYPFPSPYTRLNATQSASLGKAWLKEDEKRQRRESSDNYYLLDETAKRLLELAILEAKSHLNEDLHPIQFGAAAMLKDGSIITSHQVGALEYGCTLDAISQLATQLLQSSSLAATAEKDIPVVLLVQADQYGVAHAPFAPARSFLSEHGYGECMILLHDTSACSSNKDDDISNVSEWILRQVRVGELAPNAPAWTATVEP